MLEWRRIVAGVLSASLCLAAPTHAQSAQPPPREVVLPIENVRFDYAQVLSVRPINQMLRTTNMERVCSDPRNPDNLVPERAAAASAVGTGRSPRNCRMAPVVREFQRTIAYDVDYIYRGSKFRTRMDRDPGNRLRIRISIVPAPLH